MLWVTLSALGIVFLWLGVVGAIWYLAAVRTKVAAAQAAPRLHLPGPPPPALVSPTARPAEWLPDPTGRHELRYWDGARWSDHVSDRGSPPGTACSERSERGLDHLEPARQDGSRRRTAACRPASP